MTILFIIYFWAAAFFLHISKLKFISIGYTGASVKKFTPKTLEILRDQIEVKEITSVSKNV